MAAGYILVSIYNSRPRKRRMKMTKKGSREAIKEGRRGEEREEGEGQVVGRWSC